MPGAFTQAFWDAFLADGGGENVKDEIDSDITTYFGVLSESNVLFVNNTSTPWQVNFDGSTVFFAAYHNVTGSTQAPPWSSYFTPLRQESWSDGFSGTVTVPAKSSARVKYYSTVRFGAESWKNIPGNYSVARNHDFKDITSLGVWFFEDLP